MHHLAKEIITACHSLYFYIYCEDSLRLQTNKTSDFLFLKMSLS